MTIIQASIKAIRSLGRPSSIHDIYETIIKNHLYDFNTDVPEHVLRTTIRRHTKGVERVDSSEEELFEMNEPEMYGVIGMEKRPVTKTAAKGIKRIHRASDKEEIIQNLLSEKVGVFKEIWKLLLFAANIGYANQRREKLKSIDTGKGIDQSTFGNSPSWPGILYLINLVETGTSDSLSGSANAEDDRLLVFQEYANGGLAIVQEYFENRSIDLDGLLSFLETQTCKTVAEPSLDLSI